MTDVKELNEVEVAGGVSGLAVGLVGGAKLGSIIIPLPLVGGFLGAVTGGVLGSGVGRLIALGFVKAGRAVVQGTKATTSALTKAASS